MTLTTFLVRAKWAGFLLAALLVLPGCTSNLASVVNFGTGLQEAAQNYVNEQVSYRQQIRAECWRMLESEVRALEAERKMDQARSLLAQAYPPLSIVAAIDKEDVREIARELNEARPCLIEGPPAE